MNTKNVSTKVFLLVLAFYLFIQCAKAFTVTTYPRQTTLNHQMALKEDIAVSIDSKPLAQKYPWHNGTYVFKPHEFRAFVEGDVPNLVRMNPRPAISFSVSYVEGISYQRHNLDCMADSFFEGGYISFHTENETQRCDGGPKINNWRKDGRIEYKITKITAPSLVSTKNSLGNYSYASKVGGPFEIKVDFDVRFRIDEGTGSGGTFTPWFSTQEQINAYAAGLPTGPGTPGTGPGTPPDTNAPGPGTGPQPPVVVLPTNCNACSSIIQCLACLQYNFVSSLKRFW